MKLYEIAKKPMLIMPIGPSGSGKSTLLRKIRQQNPNIQVFSLDILRHELYDKDNYERAWQMANEDPEFRNKANAVFRDMVNKKQDLYVDNTNLTPKSRRQFLDVARRTGYQTVAVVFNTPLEELIARQSMRQDKTVPEHAVRQQHSVIKPPVDGEFDKVLTPEQV